MPWRLKGPECSNLMVPLKNNRCPFTRFHYAKNHPLHHNSDSPGICHQCNLNGCSKPVAFDPKSGRVHDFCSREHSRMAINWNQWPKPQREKALSVPTSGKASHLPKCKLTGCNLDVFVDASTGRIHDYCGRTHAVAAKSAKSVGEVAVKASSKRPDECTICLQALHSTTTGASSYSAGAAAASSWSGSRVAASSNPEIVSLVCKHSFHKHCIDSWITSSSASGAAQPHCPVCRKPLHPASQYNQGAAAGAAASASADDAYPGYYSSSSASAGSRTSSVGASASGYGYGYSSQHVFTFHHGTNSQSGGGASSLSSSSSSRVSGDSRGGKKSV
jgi:hypothetical protein